MLTAEDVFTEELEDNFESFDHENAPNEAEGAPDNEAGENSDKNPVKPKRVVRNPQPKLNAETLKGKRGLTAIASYFDRVKYKGKGHEEQDLSVILKTYEYWCHRLFPKYPFDACIEKIEKLGSKRAVSTHIKRIRMDLMLEDIPDLNEVHDTDSDHEDGITVPFDDVDLPARPEITEEQLERIRLNKERAEQLRRDRLKRANELSESILTRPIDSHNTNLLDENSTQASAESSNYGNQNSQIRTLGENDDQEFDNQNTDFATNIESIDDNDTHSEDEVCGNKDN